MAETNGAEWRSLMEALNRSLFAGLGSAAARDVQQQSLRRMAAATHARSAFYRPRLAAAMDSAGLQMARWKDIPLLTKAELRQHRSEILDPGAVSPCGPLRMGWTSGSEGEPLNYGRSQLSGEISSKVTQRFLRMWKADGSLTFAQILSNRPEVDEVVEPVMRRGWLDGNRTGEFHVFPVATDLRRHHAWLMALRPAYLKSYPEVLAELARMTLRQGRQLPMRLLISGGGMLGDDVRKLCRAAFGCAIADFYGAEEVGAIADQCPLCGDYHVASENILLEVLRPDGSDAAPGETGRAVVTTLFNDAFPLIRYELGDHVVPGGASTCARPALQTLRKVQGRSSAVFRLAGGRAIWPFVPSDEMARLANVQRFQFLQVAQDAVEFHYVPRQPEAGLDDALLQRLVSSYIDPSLRVRSIAKTALTRDDNLKYPLYRSLLA